MSEKKKFIKALTLLFSLLLLIYVPSSACAEWTKTEPNRFNVVLVVDKSGSLACENEHGTDPDGLRFDALRLFLGLLTESGNNVGAVVFDEFIRYESDVKPMEGMEAKKELIHKIEGYSPEYDTDIGTAMLRATELLADKNEQDGKHGMILLFSDGVTDFTTGDIMTRMQSSYSNAQQALDTAKKDGITINGILLNVDDAAKDDAAKYAAETFRLFTYQTNGEFVEVKQPEDLASAFQRLYHIINNTVYTGAQRVAFSELGEAEIFFTVPSFGVEEVNVIVEGEKLPRESGEKAVDIEILRPNGESFDISGHDLDCSQYRLVKVPDPSLGVWSARLRGEPDAWVDVTMVCNASLSVELMDNNEADVYRTLIPYQFTARVDDPGVPQLTEDQLSELNAALVCEELATGAVREYEMTLENGVFVPGNPFSFPRDGDYRLSAVISLGDFKLRSNFLDFSVELTPLVAQVDTIEDMARYGRFRGGLWELELPELFGVDAGSEVLYTLSDDYGGRLFIEGDVLTAQIRDAQPFSFTLTAADQMNQSAQISFDLTVPKVSARVKTVSGITELGRCQDDIWEVELTELFDDPKGGKLEYVLSSDCGGAVTIEDGTLRAYLEEDAKPLSFVLTATDFIEQSARITFDLSAPAVTARASQITNMMKVGRLHDFQWELPLDTLFSDPNGLPLTYALSDDCGGAVTVEDGVLRVDFHELREANFSLTAVNTLDRQAAIPFTLTVPGPAATVGEITETVKTGLFQENVWEQKLDSLFSEPKGTALSYTLTDDLGGAAEIDGDTLRVNMKGLKKAEFSIQATDEYRLSSRIPVTLNEKNMTTVYFLWALLALLIICVPTGIVLYRRRH